MPVAEAFELEAKQQEHGEEALHARVAKTQSAGALALNGSRALQGFECLRADPAVVAGFLDLEHAAVGRKADLAQLGQVAQKAANAEVVAIVNGGFGTQARTVPARLVILLEVRVYYILTAHHTSSDVDADALTQQQLLGLALKTFHDIPIVTDNTTIDGMNPVLPDNLRGQQNSIQIIMRQISPEDAAGFWSIDPQAIPKLSAYYEVRVIFLEPEKPRSTPGIVLNLGAYLIQIGTPALGITEGRIPFTLPASYGGGAQTIVARPARAILDDRAPGIAPGEHRRVDVAGTNLAVGVSRSVVLPMRAGRTRTRPLPKSKSTWRRTPNGS